MRFENVSIAGVAHVDAPHRITSAEIEDQLAPTLARLSMPSDVLQSLTGVRARRFWGRDVQPSAAATLAGEEVLRRTGIERGRIGVLVSTSVSRDFVEPSVACFVHQNLGLAATCANFDVTNACLGFLDGMQITASMIERGAVDYGLVVCGESSRFVVERTVERLRATSCDAATLRDQFATLTLGSGAAAILLTHARLAPEGHAYLGGVSVAATQHNRLCLGQVDGGVTDSKNLLEHGVDLAKRTWGRAREAFGWSTDSVDHFAIHQVSEVHTAALAKAIGFDLGRAFLTYPEFGNVGPASVPMALAKADRAERLHPGDRVVLAGIGSGLNATAAGIVW
jgi:3-oxoacyl-[acyl-carrier-protein] synthase-3